jgi:hypothetical protein
LSASVNAEHVTMTIHEPSTDPQILGRAITGLLAVGVVERTDNVSGRAQILSVA